MKNHERLPPRFGVVNREKFTFPVSKIMLITGNNRCQSRYGGGEITITQSKQEI